MFSYLYDRKTEPSSSLPWLPTYPKGIKSNVVLFFSLKLHRFGGLIDWIPETIVADQGTVFTGGQVKAFAEEYGITIQNSTPYYAQGNGQAEASNKLFINVSPLLCRCPLNYSRLV